MCGQNMEYLNIKPGGTYSNHWLQTANRAHGASQCSTSDSLSDVYIHGFELTLRHTTLGITPLHE